MMNAKQKTGRPSTSHNVRVVPDSLEKPDIAKLGRALLAVAKKLRAANSPNAAPEDKAA